MHITQEGHVEVTPITFMNLAQADELRLISKVLLSGTPKAFPTRDHYIDFQHYISDELGVHPMSILVRGSAKIGFSMTPLPEKLWVKLHELSDIDVAIVDPAYYAYLERELRIWERSVALERRAFHSIKKVRNCRKHLCYRYFDLPTGVTSVDKLRNVFESMPSENYCEVPRTVSAFIYRDWWSVTSRYQYDIGQLKIGIGKGELKAGESEPWSFKLPMKAT